MRAASQEGAAASRYGLTVVEIVIAMTLIAVVIQAAWTVFSGERHAAEELRVRSETLDAERTVRTVLAAEVAAGSAGRDWIIAGSGVLELRAFRGWAAVCPFNGSASELLVAYRGLREPDPLKDSLLVLDRSGSWTAAGLERTFAAGVECDGAGGRTPTANVGLERWVLDRGVEGAVLLRVFERGSYQLTDGILRYRRGEGGRQPLTPPGLEPSETGFEAAGAGAVLLTVSRATGPREGWSRTLLGNGWRR